MMHNELANNASSMQTKLFHILTHSRFFKNFNIYQEYPVNKLIQDYRYGSHRVDWYIKELGLVIELMGQQHYKPVNFSNEGKFLVLDKFSKIKERDHLKREALIAAGYTYIEIKYDEDLTESLLLSKLEQSPIKEPLHVKDKPNTKPVSKSVPLSKQFSSFKRSINNRASK